jgi:hypothetical protein
MITSTIMKAVLELVMKTIKPTIIVTLTILTTAIPTITQFKGVKIMIRIIITTTMIMVMTIGQIMLQLLNAFSRPLLPQCFSSALN